MAERTIEDSRNEKATKKQAVCLKLQDVVMKLGTTDPVLLRLREKVKERAQLYSQEDERITLLNVACDDLLGYGLVQLRSTSKEILIPYHSSGEKRKSLVISSASTASASQEAECGILQSKGHIIDIPGAIEGRDARGAQEEDIALISTESGLRMARAKGNVDIINLADEVVIDNCDGRTLKGSDIYYKADVLLLLALTNPSNNVISRLVDVIKNNSLIHLYNLDEETQIVLLWLARQANLAHLDVNANSPEVGIELTRKGFRYPTVEQALTVPYFEDPFVMQREEWKLSQAATEINHHPDTIPGYVITRSGSQEEFLKKCLTAFMLLNTRYNFDIGWIKPDRGTDGGNQGELKIASQIDSVREEVAKHLYSGDISSALDIYTTSLVNASEMMHWIDDMWDKGGDWIVEAKTNYFLIRFPVNGKEKIFTTTPSVHVIKGELRNTVSLQLTDGTAWGGNLICSRDTWNRLMGMLEFDGRNKNNPDLIEQLEGIYDLMTEAIKSYVEAVNASDKYKSGQVRGGADLAIATLGGKFGHENIVVGIQDYNARANGCETAYALYDQAKMVYGEKGEAVTRNITPHIDFDAFLSVLPKAVEQVNSIYSKNIGLDQVKLVAVSAGWGQIGMIGVDAIGIMQDIFLLEEQLRSLGMIW